MAGKIKNTVSFIFRFLGIDVILFLTFLFCILANTNIENRGMRIIAMFFCMLGVWASKIFLMRTYSRSSNTMITFMVSMVELGIFLNLYVLGFQQERSFREIADYLLGITGFVPVTLCMIGMQVFVTPQNRRNYVQRCIISIAFLVIAVGWVYGCPEIENMGTFAKQLIKSLVEIGFICAFIMFFDGNRRSFRVDNLSKKPKFYFILLSVGIFLLAMVAFAVRSQTSFRNAILEVLKVLVLLIFAVFYYQKTSTKSAKRQKEKSTLKTLLQVLGIDIVIFLVGFFAGEFGTALILSLFMFLFIFFIFSSMSNEENEKDRLGKVIALFIVIFVLIFVLLYFLCYSIYLKDSTLTITLKNLGLYDKLDRIFNLSDNPQIEEMNTAINESPRLFVALPYNVKLAGMLQTRVEDFSFMNIVTVFGSLVGSVLGVLMVIVPLKMIEDIRVKYAGKSLYTVKNLFCIGGCILFIANTAIHIIANFGLFLFTGVTLPFISKGFMNMAVFYLLFTQVLKKLDTLNDARE